MIKKCLRFAPEDYGKRSALTSKAYRSERWSKWDEPTALLPKSERRNVSNRTPSTLSSEVSAPPTSSQSRAYDKTAGRSAQTSLEPRERRKVLIELAPRYPLLSSLHEHQSGGRLRAQVDRLRKHQYLLGSLLNKASFDQFDRKITHQSQCRNRLVEPPAAGECQQVCFVEQALRMQRSYRAVFSAALVRRGARTSLELACGDGNGIPNNRSLPRVFGFEPPSRDFRGFGEIRTNTWRGTSDRVHNDETRSPSSRERTVNLDKPCVENLAP